MGVKFGYRVLRRNGEVAVFEVFGESPERPDSSTATALSPFAPTVHDLRHELQLMLAALDEPVLDYDELSAASDPGPAV